MVRGYANHCSTILFITVLIIWARSKIKIYILCVFLIIFYLERICSLRLFETEPEEPDHEHEPEPEPEPEPEHEHEHEPEPEPEHEPEPEPEPEPGPGLLCPYCGYGFPTMWRLKQHEKLQHGKIQIKRSAIR